MGPSTWTSGRILIGTVGGVERVPVVRRNEVRIVDQKLVSIGRFADHGRRLGGVIYVLSVPCSCFRKLLLRYMELLVTKLGKILRLLCVCTD